MFKQRIAYLSDILLCGRCNGSRKAKNKVLQINVLMKMFVGLVAFLNQNTFGLIPVRGISGPRKEGLLLVDRIIGLLQCLLYKG